MHAFTARCIFAAMNFADYWKSIPVPDRRSLAERCGTSFGFLQNIVYGSRECGPALAVALERATDGTVRRWHMRPADWHLIWPELVGSDGAPRAPASARAA